MSHTLSDLTISLPPEFLTGHMHHKPSPSTESESDDDDVTGLTRPFTRSVSFQDPFNPVVESVFSGFSPTTSFGQANEDCWELIYAAAEQVARMKMLMKMNTVNDVVLANRGLLGAPRHLGAPLSHQHYLPQSLSDNEEFFLRQQFRRRFACGGGYHCAGRCGTVGPVGFRQAAWPPVPLETQRRQQPVNRSTGKPVPGGGVAVVKKQRAGTGVFLPRNYSNIPPEPMKNPARSTHVPAGVAQSLNKNMDPFIAQPPQPNVRNGFAAKYQPPPPPPHRFNREELAELVTARRNAVMLPQQRRSTTHAEVVLPQEWTY